MPTSVKKRAKASIAVLISGGGRTLKNLLDKIESGELEVSIKLVVASSNCSGLKYAQEAGIETLIVERADYDSDEAFSEAVLTPCKRKFVNYVVMAGYLRRLVLTDEWTNRVLNIHPSLIPSFCGQGMYGHHVHEAVLAHGAKVTGATVHFADNKYDHGPIILQKAVPVLEGDDADTLSDRVLHEAEFEIYPLALQYLAEKRVEIKSVSNGREERQVVRILPPKE